MSKIMLVVNDQFLSIIIRENHNESTVVTSLIGDHRYKGKYGTTLDDSIV